MKAIIKRLTTATAILAVLVCAHALLFAPRCEGCWDRLPLSAKCQYSPEPRPLIPMFSLVAVEEAGWPKVIGSDLNCSMPALVDVDGDGQLEIVVGSPSNATPYENILRDAIWVFRPNGRLVEGFPALLDDSGCSSPAAGDLNGDGRPEIIMGSSTNAGSTDRKLYGFNGRGEVLPGWPLLIDEGEKRYVFGAPSLGDLDGDGLPEIIYGSRNGILYACEVDGSAVSGWPVDLKTTPIDGIGASPALGDIDNDGSLDVVAYASGGYLYALNANGVVKPGWPRLLGKQMTWGFPNNIGPDDQGIEHNQAEVTSAPVLCDIDGDDDLEIIFPANTLRAALFVLDHLGNILPGFPVYMEDDGPLFESVTSTPALGDLDGDGRREIAVWTDLGKLWVFKDDGTVPAGWPKQLATGGFPYKAIFKPSFPSIVDIDYDGDLEVLAPGRDGELDIVVLYAFEADGRSVDGWPLQLDRILVNIPTVDDIDQDGALEMVLAIQGIVHCLHVKRGESRVSPDLPWRMFHHDPFRTGNAHAWLPQLSQARFERTGTWVGPDEYAFSVLYHDHDRDLPRTAELLLMHPDGSISRHQMRYSSEGTAGESATNGRYAASLKLATPGEYEFSFHFWDGYRFHYKESHETDEVWLPSAHTYLPGPTVPERGPAILAAGIDPPTFSSSEGALVSFTCYIDHPDGPDAIERVELLYGDYATGIVLNDSGADGDAVASDSVFSYRVSVTPNALTAGSYLLSMRATDKSGITATDWPFLPGAARYDCYSISPGDYRSSTWLDETLRPSIRLGGASARRLDANGPPFLRIIALVTHPDGPQSIENVAVLFRGIQTGIFLSDSGTDGDDTAGDSIFTLVLEVPEVNALAGATLELLATDVQGNSSPVFPYLWVSP
ncbi:MAG: VCBS repeat-containing protein [Candidatus Coatesbacteria bacterium]|nr:VCBS repeat-containing protein [Candidatus Coatesbacteria bacterium]